VDGVCFSHANDAKAKQDFCSHLKIGKSSVTLDRELQGSQHVHGREVSSLQVHKKKMSASYLALEVPIRVLCLFFSFANCVLFLPYGTNRADCVGWTISISILEQCDYVRNCESDSRLLRQVKAPQLNLHLDFTGTRSIFIL
jgi:hypothetical protein